MNGQTTEKMLGTHSGDPHKNSAKCGRVNDRERRHAKRVERVQMKAAVKEQVG